MMHKIYITLKRGADNITLTTGGDTSLTEWGQLFRTILLWLGFHQNNVEEVIKEDREV
jgi:hypothetical protein